MTMNCGGDRGGLEDLVDLATDVADSSPTIRDAAERLLTLLGMEDENEELLSSSEDEGVELDENELEDDEDELENTRLLHQLAASLAEELKQSHQSHQKQNSVRLLARSPFDKDRMELAEAESSYTEHGCLQGQEVKESRYRETERCQRQDASRSFAKEHDFVELYECLDHRLRMDSDPEDVDAHREQVSPSWGAGWDACAAEALRYLVEDEGLPPHHPTVLAMKDHLETQRERAFARYTA
ncbi:uncharacterized protein LOC128890062 isoform X2 [Hylaeus anthracinus]|nr:uncharacterized protein LOC128879165 isoform X2 [Hylaeus volcanicus]XP_053984339.1 uncharacterized protein LOC128879165 isoform X2 [Hylaeus volcanicus]XP_054004225.1 uncharacterized protein LOC128890062 isoform X2 [Hylaeus anthracinus]XP_054004226.1 uncharacterized protein LOC128890062 isoform X2 [Hylaeus anthracinus]